MGFGTGFFSPYIRDNYYATNNSLQALLNEHPEKNWIGIDMSILIVKSLKKSTVAQAQIASLPPRPADALNQSVISFLKIYVENKFNIVCVFDGVAHKLKKEKAHQVRYSLVNAKKEELQRLYSATMFASGEKEKENIDQVKELWKDLAFFNRNDLLYSMIDAIKSTFKEKAVCIGAPFEADHQLASLSIQGVVDYVFSNDADLSMLGCNLITNVKDNGDCWYMSNHELMNYRFPALLGDPLVPWNLGIVKQVCSFLGNDYLVRNPGNSPLRIKKFLKEIVGLDGSLVGDDEICQYLLEKCFTPTDCSKEDKLLWKPEEKKMAHLKIWREAMEMFQHGPVFQIKHLNDPTTLDTNSFISTQQPSIRDALLTGEYKIELGSMNQTEVSWKLENPTFYDMYCDRTYLVGFDPHNDLLEKLSQRPELQEQPQSQESIHLLFKKCFQLEVWTKTAGDVMPLPEPTNDDGKPLYHGSIIDFDQVPVRYHSKDTLNFWLQNRQIKAPNSEAELRNKVQTVWDLLGMTLQPIHKLLLRGKSGYITPVLLEKKPQVEVITYLKTDPLLDQLKKTFPRIGDASFSELFGKRNGSRCRCLKHLQGGSFDIANIKATNDMAICGEPDRNIIVIFAYCTPSQKLKDSKSKKPNFYQIKLVIEVNASGEFMKILQHPYTTCECPNGCIMCSHIGSLLLICTAILKFDDDLEMTRNDDDDLASSNDDSSIETVLNTPTERLEPTTVTSFDDIRNLLPCPVNNLLTQPMMR